MRIPGIAIIVLALVVALVPYFTNCLHDGKVLTLQNGRTVPMKCAWSAQAELALALPVLGLGGALAVSRRKETQRLLGIVGVLLGIAVAAIPTVLIGTCSGADMTCNMIMRPAMILSGGLISAISLYVVVASQRGPDMAAAGA